MGFHRAVDTIGAVLGPLLGVSVLGWAQTFHWDDASGPFRLVLWLSVVPGALAVVAFLTLVNDPERSPNPGLRLLSTLRGLPVSFKRYLAAVGIFGLGDFSHSLLILGATQLLTPSFGVVHAAQIAGLLYVGRNIVQVVASYPIGACADRVGALPLLVGGYALGALTGVLMMLAFYLSSASIPLLAGIFLIAGLYVAVQDALESTVSADMVAQDTLATSYGALGTVNGCTKFLSSSVLGLLWTVVSPIVGFGLAAIVMATGTLALMRIQRERPRG
jgi:MFS family permease